MPQRRYRPKREDLGAALKHARRRRGLTQTDVSRLIDRPQSFVSNYELGKIRLETVEFERICEAIGTRPATVLRQAGL